MIVELAQNDYVRVKSLFQGLDFHLAVPALLDGNATGKVFADHPADPQSALAWVNGRLHLAGNAENETFNRAAGEFYADMIYPLAKASGRIALSLFYDREGWEPVMRDWIGKGENLLKWQREYYTLNELRHNWRDLLPSGYRLRFVDAQLLENRQLQNLEHFEAELCSERESIAEFLAKSFGACLLQANTIAAWCLSEYNHAGHCEIGIETVAAYQRRGFATLTASALIEHARTQGIERIGWHCAASNPASGAAARAIGFVKERDYPAYIAWVD